MLEGLRTAAAGMQAQQQKLDAVANDLANANTNGYKRVRVGFSDLLYERAGRPSTSGNAQLGAGSRAIQGGRTFQQGSLRETGIPTDVAIEGDGFFAVQTGAGTRYTRNGEFTADANGRLTTLTGNPVLGRNNQPVSVGADGKVDPRLLNVVLLQSPKKTGDNLVTGTPGAVAGQTAGQVRASALEGSGADPTQSMVDMMESMRAYEAGQKVIHTIDETLGKAASSVGSLS